MVLKRNVAIAGGWIAVLGALWCGQSALDRVQAQGAGTVQAPKFEVDPMWPKPLPNHWILGSAIGVSVDSRDHIWIIHRGAATLDDNENAMGIRPPASKNCCRAAPPILEFDLDGNLVNSWGGPGAGYEWPAGNHGTMRSHSRTSRPRGTER